MGHPWTARPRPDWGQAQHGTTRAVPWADPQEVGPGTTWLAYQTRAVPAQPGHDWAWSSRPARPRFTLLIPSESIDP